MLQMTLISMMKSRRGRDTCLGMLSVCIISCIVIGQPPHTDGASVQARYGGCVTLMWNGFPQGIEETTIRTSSNRINMIHVVNYTAIRILGPDKSRTVILNDKIPTGSAGIVAEVCNVTMADAGLYTCYSGSPDSVGSEIPGCQHELVVTYIQNPLISAPEKEEGQNSSKLKCFTIIKPATPGDMNVSFTWMRNDIKLGNKDTYNMAERRGQWSAWIYHTSELSVTDAIRGTDRYTCQVDLEGIKSDWSEEYHLWINRQQDENKTYTIVRQRESTPVTLKVPHLDQIFYVKSQKDQDVLALDTSGKIYIYESYWLRVKIRSLTLDTLSFLLYNVTAADAGEYYCSVGSSRRECSHLLIVLREPAKPNLQAPATAEEGHTLTLTCSATSKSLPENNNLSMSYVWRKNGNPVGAGKNSQRLNFPDVSRSDEGNYSCQAEEEGLTSEWSSPLHVEVMVSAKQRKCMSHTDGKIVVNGKPPSANVSFSVYYYPPPTISEWYFVKEEKRRDVTGDTKYSFSSIGITDNVTEFTFTINDITQEDFGIYTFNVRCGEETTDVDISVSLPGDSTTSISNSVTIPVAIIAVVLAVSITVAFYQIRIRDMSNTRASRFTTAMTEHTNASLETATRRTDQGYSDIDDSILLEYRQHYDVTACTDGYHHINRSRLVYDGMTSRKNNGASSNPNCTDYDEVTPMKPPPTGESHSRNGEIEEDETSTQNQNMCDTVEETGSPL